MDLKQLRYFVGIVESGSFTRAAEMLRIAQPSLSQQIQNLEEELGVGLLSRHARGVTLTDMGQQLYDHAVRILGSVEQAKDLIQSRSVYPSGRISVGLPTSAARHLSLPFFRELAETQPNIELHLVEAMSGYLDDLIQAGRLDVALLYNHRAFDHVAWTEMIVEDLILFVSSGHPLAQRGSITFGEALAGSVVLPGRPHVLRSVIERLGARENVEIKAFDCDSLPAISNLIISEGYMAIMPHFAFLDELARGEMVGIPIVAPSPSWNLSVVVSHRTINPRGSEVVAKTLANVIAQLVREGTWRARLKDTLPPDIKRRTVGPKPVL